MSPKCVFYTLLKGFQYNSFDASGGFVSVRFRVVVFRPFVDEILVGKIRSCSSEGVRGWPDIVM